MFRRFEGQRADSSPRLSTRFSSPPVLANIVSVSPTGAANTLRVVIDTPGDYSATLGSALIWDGSNSTAVSQDSSTSLLFVSAGWTSTETPAAWSSTVFIPGVNPGSGTSEAPFANVVGVNQTGDPTLVDLVTDAATEFGGNDPTGFNIDGVPAVTATPIDGVTLRYGNPAWLVDGFSGWQLTGGVPYVASLPLVGTVT